MEDSLYTEYSELSRELSDCWNNQSSQRFQDLLVRLEDLARRGSDLAAGAYAEIRALPGPAHDAAAAYVWYYVELAMEGYLVAFDDQNDLPPYYCGPIGDFRNESMVSGLVTELGYDRIRELDGEAANLLRTVRGNRG